MKGATGGKRVLAAIVNDWQLSSVWTAATGTPYSATFSYQNGGGNVNLTGSPDFGAPHPDRRRSGLRLQQQPVRPVQRRAFQGPLVGSTGLESSNNYLVGCFQSALDLSLQREIPFGGSRRLQLRVDIFNAPNQAIIIPQNGAMAGSPR